MNKYVKKLAVGVTFTVAAISGAVLNGNLAVPIASASLSNCQFSHNTDTAGEWCGTWVNDGGYRIQRVKIECESPAGAISYVYGPWETYGIWSWATCPAGKHIKTPTVYYIWGDLYY